MYLNKKNVCSCFCKSEGHGLTNSSCASCYEGCLALERVELLYGGHCVCESFSTLNRNNAVVFGMDTRVQV